MEPIAMQRTTRSSLWLALSLALAPSFLACAQNEQPAPAQPPAETPAVQPAATPQPAGEGVWLGPKFTPGNMSIFEQVSIAKGTQSFDDQTFPNDTTTILVMRVECQSVDENGVATVSMKYDRISLSGDSMFLGQYSFDSDDPNIKTNSPEVAAILETVLQMKVTATVGTDGKIQTLTGGEEIFNEMSQHEHLKALVGPFGSDATKQTMESFWLIGDPAPARPVGSTWREVKVTPTWFGNLVVESDFTVSSADAEKAVVDLAVNLKAERIVKETDPDQDMSEILEFNWDSPVNMGQINWDRARGELVDRTSNVSFKMTVRQQPLFEGSQQTVITQQDVVTTFKRIGMK